MQCIVARCGINSEVDLVFPVVQNCALNSIFFIIVRQKTATYTLSSMAARTQIVVGLLFVVSCGANSEAPQTPSLAPTSVATSEVPITVVEEPTVIKAVIEAAVIPPAPGMVTDRELWVGTKNVHAKGGGNIEPIKLGKRCTFIGSHCDLSTAVLTLDGSVLDFKPDNSDTASPFGDWKSLSAYSTRKAPIQHETEFGHIRTTLDNGVFTQMESLRFPRTIEKTIPNTLDFDGDDSPDVLRLTCKATTYATRQPTACRGYTLWMNWASPHLVDNSC